MQCRPRVLQHQITIIREVHCQNYLNAESSVIYTLRVLLRGPRVQRACAAREKEVPVPPSASGGLAFLLWHYIDGSRWLSAYLAIYMQQAPSRGDK